MTRDDHEIEPGEPDSHEQKDAEPTHPHEMWHPDDYEQCRLLKIYPDSVGAFMWQAGICINLGDWEQGNEDLERRFSAWANEYPDLPEEMKRVDPNDPKWQDWKLRGLALAKEVRAIVPAEYTIFYYPFDRKKIEIRGG